MPATLVVRRVRLVPLDGGPVGTPVDLRIVDGTIVERGQGLRGEAELHAEGRWAIPGLWDQHVHATQWVRTSMMVPLARTSSAADVVRVLADRVAQLPDDDRLLLGFGYRSATWPGAGTTEQLDAISRGHPIVAISGDAHTGWLNSRAQALLGVAGLPGPVSENDWFGLFEQVSALPEAVPTAADVRATMAAAAAKGVTGLVDYEFRNSFLDWPGRVADGLVSQRIRAATYADQLDEVIRLGYRTGQVLDDDGLVRMGPLKIILDGSMSSLTAWCSTAYPPRTDRDEPRGRANLTRPELRELVARARAAGIAVAVHAIGDQAARDALDIFEYTGAKGSIEHAQLLTDQDVVAMARLGVAASVQPHHLVDDRDAALRVWPDRTELLYRFATLARAGVELRLGSDAPVSPLDPWLAMACAVHRSGDDRPGWLQREAISPRDALRASVDGQRLAPGCRGDVVLLDVDPLADEAPDPTRHAGSHLAPRPGPQPAPRLGPQPEAHPGTHPAPPTTPHRAPHGAPHGAPQAAPQAPLRRAPYLATGFPDSPTPAAAVDLGADLDVTFEADERARTAAARLRSMPVWATVCAGQVTHGPG